MFPATSAEIDEVKVIDRFATYKCSAFEVAHLSVAVTSAKLKLLLDMPVVTFGKLNLRHRGP